MATTTQLDLFIELFRKDIYRPSPTYNDLVLALEAVRDTFGNGAGGCDVEIDLKDRLGVLESFDLASRLDIANAYWNFCNRI